MAANSANRLQRLLSDILDISRVEAGKMDIREEQFRLAEVVQSIKDIFRQTAIQNENSLEIYLDEAIPGLLIGDQTRLTQILFNLVGNACKYTQKGSIEVKAWLLEQTAQSTCRILFIIEDTGEGIPEEKLQSVFETFTQANDSSSPYSRKYEGAGLGLPLVKRLVRLMGGNASITSQKGEGTSVYVSLSFKIPESKQATEQISEPYQGKNAFKVLLADDDETTQFQIRTLLEKQGNEVAVVNNGEQVLEKLEEDEFDCVLMDIQMPVLDGVEATKRIRNSKAEYRDIPVIALTAYAMSGDREKFLEYGMDNYMDKPVDKVELLQVIERNVAKK